MCLRANEIIGPLMKNKLTIKDIDYSEKVFLSKYYLFKKASEKYMIKRSAQNFDRVRSTSDEFKRYVKIHSSKYLKFWAGNAESN